MLRNRTALIGTSAHIGAQPRFFGRQLRTLISLYFIGGNFPELVFTRMPHEYRHFIVGWPVPMFTDELINSPFFLLTALTEFPAQLRRNLFDFDCLVCASFIPTIFNLVTETCYLTRQHIAIDFREIFAPLIESTRIECLPFVAAFIEPHI